MGNCKDKLLFRRYYRWRFELKIKLLNDKHALFIWEKMIMQLPQSRRDEVHDTLCEELLRERAAVLSRAGIAVEIVLAELAGLDQEIQIKNERLGVIKQYEQVADNLHEWRMLLEDINISIDQFNTVREKAQLKYYYLIVTREALGLRRHDRIQEI